MNLTQCKLNCYYKPNHYIDYIMQMQPSLNWIKNTNKEKLKLPTVSVSITRWNTPNNEPLLNHTYVYISCNLNTREVIAQDNSHNMLVLTVEYSKRMEDGFSSQSSLKNYVLPRKTSLALYHQAPLYTRVLCGTKLDCVTAQFPPFLLLLSSLFLMVDIITLWYVSHQHHLW